MKIVDIREATVPIESAIRNAYIDFSQMTVSIVAIVTDVVRDGGRVVGYGFNSNGRYAQGGILRERLIPRVMAAAPGDLLDEAGDNFDPFRIWGRMMANEKPGGHGDRAVAVAALLYFLEVRVENGVQRPVDNGVLVGRPVAHLRRRDGRIAVRRFQVE